MKKKIQMIFILFVFTLAAGSLATTSLVVYSNFALIQSNVLQRSGKLFVIPTTNDAVENSLTISEPLNWYEFHRAEKYSLDEILKNYMGKVLQFNFQNGAVRKVMVISYSPVILKDVQTGQVYFSPSGEYIFPSIPSIDSKNYFLVSPNVEKTKFFDSTKTNVKEISYSYLSSNIGWNAVYTLDVDSSQMNGNVNLWNRTDTTFKNFHLSIVAGKPNVTLQRKENFGKAIVLSAAPSVFSPPNQSQNLEGYKVYDFGNVDSLNANSSIFISLFSKKVKLEKINVAYQPSRKFEPVTLVAEIQHDFPMPQGLMSLYTKSQKVEYFLGQVNIPNSPASALLNVPYGKNFDVEAKNVEKQRSMISKDVYLYTYEVSLRNSSNKTQGVWVYEYVPTGSIVTPGENVQVERVSSNEVHFFIKVKAHSKVDFIYRVQTSY